MIRDGTQATLILLVAIWSSTRPLGQIACIRDPGVIISELGVGYPDITALLSLARRVYIHRRVGNEDVVFRRGRQLVFDHRHPSVRRLHNIVVFDGSEVEQRFFLNGLAWGLLDLLLSGNVALDDLSISLRLHLVTGLVVCLLDGSGHRVDRVMVLHFEVFLSKQLRL